MSPARDEGKLHFCSKIYFNSSVGTSLTFIITNRFLNASDSSFRPPYPSVGF